MNGERIDFWRGLGLMVCGLVVFGRVANAQTNSWTNNASSFWQTAGNWSLGVAPTNTQAATLVTNASSKTITIDSITSGNFPGTMTISNLTLSGPVNSTNTLAVNNAGINTPLYVLNGLTVTNGGLLTITNSALRVDGVHSNAFVVEGEMRMTSDASVSVSNADSLAGMRVGTNPGGVGTLTIAGGTLTVSAVLRAGGGAGSTGTIWMTGGNVAVATKLGVATSGTGRMIISNGNVSTTPLIVGELSGSRGTLTLAGGTATVSDVMVIGRLLGATGAVWMTGGELTVTNNTGQIAIEVGQSGVGQMTVTNGTVRTLQINAGSSDGGLGTFTMAGGTVTAAGGLFAAGTNTSRGTIWISGGQLLVSNEFVDIGFKGSGQLTISNGTIMATNMIVADYAGSQGGFTMAGGTLTLSGFMNIGHTGTGTALVAGGFLAANQAPGSLMIVSNGVSIGYLGVGQMLVTNGSVLVNPLVVGNLGGSAGTLTLAGGSVSVSAANPAIASVMGLGNMAGATGTCWVTGGELLITNSGSVAQVQIGSFGVGQMIVSSGVVRANSIFVGSFPGSEGTLTVVGGAVFADRLRLGTNNNTRGTLRVTGGTFTVLSGPTNALLLGDAAGATGSVQVTGGSIIATNVPTRVGSLGYGQMTVSNGVVQTGQTDIGAGTNTFGSLAVAGGNVIIRSNLTVGLAPGSTGVVTVSAGTLAVTNAPLGIGNDGTTTNGVGVGQMTVSNGTLLASTILLGSSAGGRGEMTLGNGGAINSVGSNPMLVVNGFGQIGGDLSWTNIGSAMYCGYAHPGAYTLSNGTSSCQDVYVGYDNVGTMTIAGGAMTILSRLILGQLASPMSTGAVWITGGQLTMTNNYCIIGNSGFGQIAMSNGTVAALAVIVGNGGNPGTLTMVGGTMTVSSNMTVGNCGAGRVGFVTMTGGILYITNTTHTAVLDVQDGTFLMSGGLLHVDKLIVTNSCGRFVHTGGTLVYNQLILDPNMSAVGDGIPNGWKQKYGLDPFDPNVANEDPDGDGFSNLQEYQAGTDPNNPASTPLRITAIARESANIRVTWNTFPGTTNALQATTGGANGNYATNGFVNIFSVTNVAVSVTNYLDLGAATNTSTRYYRVRLVP